MPARVRARPADRIQYACSACGALTPRWEGRCRTCGEWNTLVEELERGSGWPSSPRAASEAVPLDSVGGEEAQRRPTGIAELDRVLGGGVVGGALILLGGDPGIGKSTLALQVAHRHGSEAVPALYCAGEESAAQLVMRARRLGCASRAVTVLAETDIGALATAIADHRPAIAIVDSVQTAHDPAVPGTPGSPSQVREAVARLLVCAKSTGIPILLIGHVTKEGAIAGPRTLEHMVDVVLYLEGERHGEHRLLRGIKNRFGPAGELGIFTMAEGGLVEVGAPGRAFLDETSLGVPGGALTVACEGSRSLLVEVQALTAESFFVQPRRTASGFDLGRLHLLLAVLEKRAGMRFGKLDVYVNAVGGVRLGEPAADLAVALAIAGSVRDRALPEAAVVLGEIGLGGEVRRVRRLEARLAEAAMLGMATAVIPGGHAGGAPGPLVRHRVGTLREALAILD